MVENTAFFSLLRCLLADRADPKPSLRCERKQLSLPYRRHCGMTTNTELVKKNWQKALLQKVLAIIFQYTVRKREHS